MSKIDNSGKINDAYDLAIELALEAGDHSTRSWGHIKLGFKTANISNIRGAKKHIATAVSPVDMSCQEIYLRGLMKGGFHELFGVFAEEDTKSISEFVNNPYARFVIDAMDGSFNFAMANHHERDALEHRLNQKIKVDSAIYSTSIGFQVNKTDFEWAVIYFPMNNELYTAKKGEGAYLNWNRLTVPQSDFKEDKLIAINSKSDFAKKILPNWTQPICSTYCVTGVAASKLAASYSESTWLHDIGPPSRVALEAGAVMTNAQGNPLKLNKLGSGGFIKDCIFGPNVQFNKDLGTLLSTYKNLGKIVR